MKIITIDRYKIKVTEYGEVFSLIDGDKLIPTLQSRGYYQVRIAIGGIIYRPLVHRLVAEAFLGMNPEDVVTHKGNKLNNHYSNLIVHSRKKAMKRAYDNGSMRRKLTYAISDEDVAYIRKMHPRIKEVDAYAQKYGVSKSYIQKILNGRFR